NKLKIDLDEKEQKLLLSIIENEPITAYKIALYNSMHFSYVYKKMEQFESEELVAHFRKPGDGRKLYYALPKGVMAAMAHGLGSRRLLVEKLRSKWGLADFADEEISVLVKVLAQNYRHGLPLNDIVMSSYYLYIHYLSDDIVISSDYKFVLDKLFKRAFETLLGVVGERCAKACREEVARREFIT
ncbi:MAG: MarR family transcriptional regulator, partial [Thermoproteus sp.]|nr:MarR family transcriptional regulator [Thermoproteus sp.]